MVFDVAIYDLDNDLVETVTQYSDLKVEIPLSDSRLAEVKVPMFDDSASAAVALHRLLAVAYNGHLVFYGPILNVSRAFRSGEVVIQAHDPSLRMKHHHVNRGDTAIVEGADAWGFTPALEYTYAGLYQLLDACRNSTSQDTAGVKDIGIIEGTDTAGVPTDPNDIQSSPVPRGTLVWDQWQTLIESARTEFLELALDWELEPEAGTDGDGKPYYAKLNTYAEQGEDRTVGNPDDNDPIVFGYGYGANDTLDDVTWETDGEATVNNSVLVREADSTSEEGEGATGGTRVIARNPASWVEVGVFSEWEQAGSETMTIPAMAEKGLEMVRALSFPVERFEMTLRGASPINALTPPRYPDDFGIGDFITCRMKKGVYDEDLNGRVVKVTLNQTDQSGNSRVDVECIPYAITEIADIELQIDPPTDGAPPDPD